MTNAKKQILIAKPPNVMMIHLKRFNFLRSSHGEKINKKIDFEETFKLEQFMVNPDVTFLIKDCPR